MQGEFARAVPSSVERSNDVARQIIVAIGYALLLIVGLAMIFPFVWTIGTSLKLPGEIFYYPPAFSAASLAAIRDVVAPEDLIEATDEDAARFNVNAVNIDDRLVMAKASPELVARLAERGYRVSQVDLLPFLMSGGGAYCMALRLDNCSAEASALRRAAE